MLKVFSKTKIKFSIIEFNILTNVEFFFYYKVLDNVYLFKWYEIHI